MMKKMIIHQADVCTAFLHSEIDGLIHVLPPEPYRVPGTVWRLNKTMYGLKQSPRCWAKKFKEVMEQIGFKSTNKDPCIFVRVDGDEINYILVYVDDLLLASKSMTTINAIKGQLKDLLKIKDLGVLGTFLGVNISLSANGDYLQLSQKHYIEQLVKRYELERELPVEKLPLLHTFNLESLCHFFATNRMKASTKLG